MCKKKTANSTLLAKIDLSFCPNTDTEFFRFFLIFDIFFGFEKTIKSRNLNIISQKDYALHPGSFWVIDRNDSQIRLKDFSTNVIFEN